MAKASDATLPASLYADASYDAERILAEPDERKISGTKRLWDMVGGGIIFQWVETDDGFDTGLTQTEPTIGRTRLQGLGLYPEALAIPMRSWMFSTKQKSLVEYLFLKMLTCKQVNVYIATQAGMKSINCNALHGQGQAVTIKTVAAEAGVSIATVSRVLTGANAVGKQVKERVLKAVHKFDYHPNRLARGLRAGKRKVIGVIIPDLQNPFLTGVVHGIESVLYKAGYVLVLGHSDGLAEREQEQIAVLRGEGAAGLILIPDNGVGANYESLQTWGVPVVAVDRIPRGLKVDLVCTDHREGTKKAISHFISHGYKDIAIINGPLQLSVAQERLAGYREALRLAGITLRESFIVHSDFRQAGGQKAMAQLLDMPKYPRAVLVGNNLMTLGSLQAIHERSIRIPKEIAIIGFDDMPWALSLRPPLSAIAQPIEELGQIAAKMLLERLGNPRQAVRHVILPAQLIVRATCGTHQARKNQRLKRSNEAKLHALSSV